MQPRIRANTKDDLKTYDAERDLGNVGLGRDQVAEPGHGRGTVQHPLVHAGEKKVVSLN